MRSTDDIIRDEHFKLLAFLITSARGCIDEPHLYGPLRLVDAASKLINIMRLEGKTIEGLEKIQEMIEEKKHLVMHDEREFIKFLDELIMELVKIVKAK
ncbi:MAG: DUF6092 family protein [Desulfurococcaceae archaeon TW002]